MKKLIGIYKITNPKNKIYIGQSINLLKREWCYKRLYCQGQIKIYRSILKYGYKNHKFEIIEECSQEFLNEREKYWIKFYDTFNTKHGLNLTDGGTVFINSEETKLKQSNIRKLKFKTDRVFYDKVVKQLNSKSKKDENNPKYGKGRHVYQFDINKNFIGEFISFHYAGKYLNISPGGIYNCCKRIPKAVTYRNFIWRFKDDCVIIDGKLQEEVLFRKIQINKVSKYKGVNFRFGKWHSRFYNIKTKKSIYLGLYNTEEEAGNSIKKYISTLISTSLCY